MKKLLLLLCLYSCFSLSAQEVPERDTLLVGCTTAPPFIIENNGNLEGINIWLWEQIAADLGKPYRLVQMDFPEMLDALKQSEIDISINPLTITSERSKNMEFTHSFYASNATVAVAQVSTLQKIADFIKAFFNINFLRAFMGLLILISVFGVLAWLFERNANPQFRKGAKGLWDGFYWSAVTLTTVGYGDKAPKTKMGKINAFALMFTGLLFISGLTAGIASSLTVSQLDEEQDSFDAFKERKVGTIQNTSSQQFLKTHFFKNVNAYDNVAAGLAELRDQKLEAFIYDEPILKYRIKQDSTLQNLDILPIKFDVQFYAFGIAPHHLELEQHISQQILEITESNQWRVILNEYGLTEL